MSVSLLLDPLPKPWCNINTNNINTNNQTTSGNLTVTGVINDGNTQIGSGYVSVFGTPTGPTGINMIYGLTTDPSSTAYLIGGNTNSFNHKFHGGGQSDPVRFTINAQGAVNTTNNTLDDGSGNQNIIGNSSYPNGTNRQQISVAMVPNAGTGTANLTVNLSRLGDTVNISFPAISATLSNSGVEFISSAPIPSIYRPLSNVGQVPLQVVNNGTHQTIPGLLFIQTSGTLVIFLDWTAGINNFSAGAATLGPCNSSYSIY